MKDIDQEMDIIEENVRPYVGVHVDYIGLPPRELSTWIALRSFIYNRNSKCFPSIRRVADMQNCDIRTVKRAIKTLSDKGLISIAHRQGTSSIYKITNKILYPVDKFSIPVTKMSLPP